MTCTINPFYALRRWISPSVTFRNGDRLRARGAAVSLSPRKL